MRSLRHTLVSWRLDSRASRLASPSAFQAGLLRASRAISEFESLRIDDADLAVDLPDRLWEVIYRLDVVDNKAKLVAGTTTLHHPLPELVPPMDRAWTGRFFGLHAPEWHSEENQHRAFRRVYLAFRDIATAVHPNDYVTDQGWRTSRSKVLDNALIAYTRHSVALAATPPAPHSITFVVAGTPPAKSEAKSMLAPEHPHADRVRALLDAADDALHRNPRFTPLATGAVRLDVVVCSDPRVTGSDATNYLGGIADVLEDKSRRAEQTAHLGPLADVWLYRNDNQITQIHYRHESGTPGYRITLTALQHDDAAEDV